MTQNLITRNGTAVHAQNGSQGVPVCSPNMASKGHAPVAFLAVDAEKAPVTCKNCLRKLGQAAPKTMPVAKVAKVETESADASVEAGRAAMIEWAELEVSFEGGTLMDALHGAAITLDGFRKGGRKVRR